MQLEMSWDTFTGRTTPASQHASTLNRTLRKISGTCFWRVIGCCAARKAFLSRERSRRQDLLNRTRWFSSP